jgi:hypothetical protein
MDENTLAILLGLGTPKPAMAYPPQVPFMPVPRGGIGSRKMTNMANEPILGPILGPVPTAVDPENTIPARQPVVKPIPWGPARVPPVPSPVDMLEERFPEPRNIGDFNWLQDLISRRAPALVGKPIVPGTEERYLDPTKVTL